jgi:hypothetical protein
VRWERPELAPEEPLVPDSVQKFLAGMSHNEEPDLKLSPAADQAMAKLVELFSDPTISSKAQFRCSVEGPTEVESCSSQSSMSSSAMIPIVNGKRWVRRLYRLELISTIPSEWAISEENRKR